MSSSPYILSCFINNQKIDFEIDSGSHVSTIRQCDADRAGVVISPTKHRVIGYSGNAVKLCGETYVNVTYGHKMLQHKFLVVNSSNVNLLGRDLCQKMNIKLVLPDVMQQCDKVNNVNVDKYDDVRNSILSEFKTYLADDFESDVKHKVSLNVMSDAEPIFMRARPVPLRLQSRVKEELDRLTASGKISKVYSSDWASPTVNVLKDENNVRICGDFSVTVNKFLNSVQTPLPSIDEVIAQVGSATIFSKIDLAHAFLQLPLDEESKKYTTINTFEGLYRYNYLPFGLRASPGIFQAFMLQLLNGINDVIIYQDDLLILSPNVDKHTVTLRKVLNTLKNAGIKVNKSKCSFFTGKVHYLGHVFNSTGVHTDPEKVRSIVDAPAPQNLKQLQAFLGLCNYYKRFIPNFTEEFAPLYKLLRKNAKFVWSQEQQNCFDTVKSLFTSHNVLQLYNPYYETLLETDSSGYGIAAVLLQRKDRHSQWLPVKFASRTLNDAERNYSNLEREALSVVFGCEKFREFLLGSKFIIRNDQQPLRKLLSHTAGVPFTCSARLQRWYLRLAQFDYCFEYSRGTDNVNSDCLSRLPLPEQGHDCEPYELIFTVNSLSDMNITCVEIQKETDKNESLSELKHCIKFGIPINAKSNLLPYKNVIKDLSIMKGCILYQNRVLIPQSLRQVVLEKFHDGHPGICSMKSIVRSLIWYPNIDHDVEMLVKNCDLCQSVQARPSKNKHVVWPTPPRPWSRIHIDHFFYESNTCLIVVDALSKYIEVEIVHSTSVNETIDALRLIFSRNGLCDTLVSDNASCFTASQFKQFLHNNGIIHISPPPYSPSSNGQAERGVRVVKDLLKKYQSDESFKTRLAQVLFHYRTVPHSVTNIPPSVSLNNRKFVSVKDRINPKYVANKPSCETKQIYQFEVGDKVLALNLRDGPKWFHGTVVQKLGVNVYNVHVHQLDVVWKRHCNQLLLSNVVAEEKKSMNNDSSRLSTFNEVPSPPLVQPCIPVGSLPGEKSINNESGNLGTLDASPPHHPIVQPYVSVGSPTNNLPNNDVSLPNVSVTCDRPKSDMPPIRRSVRNRKPVIRYGFDEY